jgi:hypothetical protein
MEEKLKQETENKEETVSNNKKEKSISEILNQGIILTMRNDIASLKREKESISMEKKERKDQMLINMIKTKAGEGARVKEKEKKEKREEMEKKEKELEKERKEIETIKTKAKKREIEIIEKKQKELAEEKEREREKEIEEQKRKMEMSKIEEEKIIQNVRKRAVEEDKERKSKLADRRRLEEKLKKEKIEVEEKLKELLTSKLPLEKKKANLDGNKNMLKDILKDILKDEAELESKKRLTEQKEAEITNPTEKHKVEKERWKIEKKIKEIEQQKWKQLEDIREIEKQIKDIDIKFEESLREENKLKEIEKKTINLQEKIKLEREKEKIKKEIELYHLQLAPLISGKIELEAKNKQTNKELQDILIQESEIERKVKVFKEKKQEAGGLEEEKTIGEKIWGIERERQIIEKDRWEKQKEIDRSTDKMNEIDLSYKKILAEKEKLEATIIEINNLLKNVNLPSGGIGKVETEKEREMQEEVEIGETKQESFSVKKDKEGKLEQEQKDIISEIKEKLIAEEKIKEEPTIDAEKIVKEEQEIEQDEIERKRQEAKKQKEIEEEKQRILAKEKILKGLEKISPNEEKERKIFLDRIKNKQEETIKQKSSQEKKIFTLEKPGGEIIYRPLPKTQSSQEKILMRVLIFLFLVSVSIAIYLLKSKYL